MSRLYRYFEMILPDHVKPHGATVLKWAIVGYMIRLLIMPLLNSGDELTTAWISLTLIKDFQWIPSNDPPLVFYLFAIFYTIARPLLPIGTVDFLTPKSSGVPSFSPPAMSLQLFSSFLPGAEALTFITEIPFLLFDFALAFLLLRFLTNGQKSLTIFKLWMLNPVVLYVSFMIGQFDIIAIFFFVLALYSFKTRRAKTTMLFLGIAGAFKVFTLLFALPIALIYVKEKLSFPARFRTGTVLLIISFLPLFLSLWSSALIPMHYESANAALATVSSDEFNGYYGTTLYSRGKPGQPFLSGLFLFTLGYSLSFKTLAGFWDTIYIFPLVYGLFLLGVVFWKDWNFNKLWKVLTVFLLSYYAFTLFHPQWFLWVQPLLILLVVENREKFTRLYLAFVPLYFAYTLYWNTDAVFWMESIGLPGIQVLNLLRSVFSALCVFTAFLILREHFSRVSPTR